MDFDLSTANEDSCLSFLIAAKNQIRPSDFIRYLARISQRFDRFINIFMEDICNAPSEELRGAQQEFLVICRRYSNISCVNNNPLIAIKPIYTALIKIRRTSDSLTPLHPCLLQLCLAAKTYEFAHQLLEEETFNIKASKNSLNIEDYLKFCYYGGLIYAGLKNYQKSFLFFSNAVTAPATIISAIVVESYKKFVLLSLLCSNSSYQCPKFTSTVVCRTIPQIASAYTEFANAYRDNSAERMNECVAKHLEIYKKDNNFGLIKQCTKRLNLRLIKKKTEIFLTLSFTQIAETLKINVDQVESVILQMIVSGDLHATIDQNQQIINFSADSRDYNNTESSRELENRIRKAIQITEKMQQLDVKIRLDKRYIGKQILQENTDWGKTARNN
eukprot:TRINITY_DN1372_c0_g2_i1.p1 TRINITY_DN1372_c0_g2~~TRINITY_DN1372_c0_g2_i1.p1  ORF type:complete len:388 (-),score=138.37 TRINITY_DN1372_c0_g2_i1:104-1267(-)